VNAGLVKFRISQCAASLFATKGFNNVVMRDIAASSSVDEVALYTHFGTKQDIVLFIYQSINTGWQLQVDEVAPGPLAARFRKALTAKIDLLKPYENFIGMIADSLALNGPLSANSPQTTHIRAVALQSIDAIIDGSTDADGMRGTIDDLTALLYAIHSVVVLLHVHAPDRARTDSIIDAAVTGLERLHEDQTALASFAPKAKEITQWINEFLHRPATLGERIGENIDREILKIIFNNRKLVTPPPSSPSPLSPLSSPSSPSSLSSLSNPLDGSCPEPSCNEGFCEACFRLHESKIRYFTSQNQPVHFVLPAFPAKSPNTSKVLGKLPDLGEEVALVTLETMCKEIQSVYAPGALITICSDGRIFSELVGVTDIDVSDYVQSVHEMILRNNLSSINIVNLEDLLEGGSFDQVRAKVLETFAEDIDELHARLGTSGEFKGMFNGIHRFITDDRRFLYPEISATQTKEQSKPIALKVIQHSNAWTRFLATVYPTSVRLSIHPYPAHSDKIGIQITKATDNWITPWHGVIVLEDDGYVLMKRSEAEALGAQVVYRHNRPYFYSALPGAS
jgi:pyoverdine/dityrosine biosynthesis protein Dit1/AcrR family transcriptional regulator